MIGDSTYNGIIMDINQNGVWDKGEVRAVYDDGSPALTKSIFGRQFNFDAGVIPLISTKKVFTKTAIKEMLLFWVKQTVLEKDFKSENVKVWDEWFDNGSLGKSYAYQFESRPIREVVIVQKREFVPDSHQDHVKVECLIPKVVPSKHDGLHTHEKYGDFEVLGETANDGDYKIVVRFVKTGFVTLVNSSDFIKRLFKDVYNKIDYFGNGCLGDLSKVKNLSDDDVNHLKVVWTNMLKRCYNSNDRDYCNYGAKGCKVSNRWQCFEFFLEDVKLIPQYFIAKQNGFKGWCLDKDYYSANYYSLNTCVFITKSDNVLYVKSKPFSVSGDLVNGVYISTLEVASLLNCYGKGVNSALKGVQKTCKSHKFEFLETDEIYRYKLSENQVINLINEIKNNPNSKRLLTSFWNFRDVKDKALQECAFQTQWKVTTDQLDLILTQRSCDSGLGLPFNWFQYKALQCAIAHCCGLKCGVFHHQIGDLHYYDRHESLLLDQICGEVSGFEPELRITANHKNFFELTVDDFELTNYESIGDSIPMSIAI